MTQIEEIEKLYAKDKTYLIPAKPKAGEPQAKIVIKQMELDNMTVFDIKEDAPPSEIAKTTIKMIALSLGIDEDAAKKVSFAHMEELFGAIMDANNLKGEDQKKLNPIKDFIKTKNAQITKENEKNGVTD